MAPVRDGFERRAVALLTAADFLAGAINAAAGGGSLVSFPALIAVGYPPLLANVTNNIAVVPGYVAGVWGYRERLRRGQGRRIVPLAAVSALGSITGVGLILVSLQGDFEDIVPFLILAACALLVVRPAIGRRLGKRAGSHERPGVVSLAGQTLAAVYGYFGAALGVAVLALLGPFFDDELQRLNALKALLQLVIGVVREQNEGTGGRPAERWFAK